VYLGKSSFYPAMLYYGSCVKGRDKMKTGINVFIKLIPTLVSVALDIYFAFGRKTLLICFKTSF
jgi:hypothetical protein